MEYVQEDIKGEEMNTLITTPMDFSDEEIIALVINTFGNDTLFTRYNINVIRTVLNTLQKIHFMEERSTENSQLLMDTLMFISHKNEYGELLDYMKEGTRNV